MEETITPDLQADLNNEATNSKAEAMMALLEHPLELLKQGKKYGIKGVKRFFTNIFLFGFTNFILTLVAIFTWWADDFHMDQFGFVLLIIVLGIGATAAAGYKTYQFVIMDTLRVVYENSTPYFKKLSNTLVEGVANVLKGKPDTPDNQITKAINMAEIVNQKFQNTPKLFQKGVMILMNRIPFIDFVSDIRSELGRGDYAAASDRLYNSMDGFITENIFGSNNTRWMLWAIPLNIIVSLIIIFNFI